VAGEPQPQIDIHRTVSRHYFFFSSFDDTTTELELHAEGLNETVLHLNLGYFVLFCFGFGFCLFCFLFFSPLMRQ
jgi:hypothetical protein